MTYKVRLLGLLVFIGLAVSCSTDSYNTSDFIAGDAFTSSNIRVVLVDTMTVEVSTIKFDSINTGSSSRVLIGQYVDPIFGTVSSANYSGFLPNSYYISTDAKYDSIVLFLKYDGYYYNDTTKTNSIQVKRLIENFNPDEDDYFYNTSTVASNDEIIGTLSYSPRPQSTDSLQIKLSDNLGIEFFNNLQNKVITNTAEFTSKFKGLSIQPGNEDNGSVIGFEKSTSTFFMRLYYSTAEETDIVQSYTDISLNSTDSPNPFFNQISAENPISYLQELTNGEMSLSSSKSNNQSYIQSGTGYATTIELPYLKTIKNIGGQGTLLKAALKIKPVLGSYNDFLMLRDYLTVYQVDSNNDITQQLNATDGSALSALLNTANQEYNDVYYEISLTSYIENILTTDLNSNNTLLLIPENYNATVDRFILNGTNNTNYKTVLELTYAVYDENN